VRRPVKIAIALASGALLFLSCADFDIWPLTWFAVAPLLVLAMDKDTKRPAAYGFLTGLVANGGGFYWIVGFLQRFGHLPLVAAVPIFLLLISYQAITFAAFAWAVRRVEERLHLGLAFVAPIAYVALELVVPFVFPWYLAITQAWVRPVVQIADLTGPLGVSFLIILSNATLYDLYAARRAGVRLPLRRVGAALAVIALSLAYGQVRIHQVEARRHAAEKLRVGVVQANIGIHEKWRPQLAATQLEIHQELSVQLERAGAQLILWPESSYPFMFRRDQAHDWPSEDPRQAQRGFATPLLFGSLTMGGPSPYPYNSALLLDKEGNVRGQFDKNILMVFGEYIPFFDQMKWVKTYIPEVSNWARGSDVAVFPLDLPSGNVAQVGPMICYEDIFPSFGRRLARKGPNLLVNITNDAWFGRTSEPYEHLALAVYRSVELRLDLVRAVNTGVSAFVDSTGRVYHKSRSVDPDEQPSAPPVTLLDEVAVQQPSMIYATLGEWFGGLCLALLLYLGARARAKAGRPIRWELAAVGAAALLLAAVVITALLAGPSRVGLALNLLAHRTIENSSDDAAVAFRTGLVLVLAVALGCLASGFAVMRRAREPRPLETAVGVLLVLVLPAVALGTLEGEQAGLVIGALLAVGVALLGGRLARASASANRRGM
jgi:apolipoprotein N-acyltransferase